ncbi:cobalamin biosynthesis protein CobT [Histomonas meleagridis]|uniref:cobalamin biosynthesis protein CobT n=1 Tax=Histomonas meleagridis TaxID=135588 RepID=UPI003559AF94|nr:cobalamin biosynthesis protein CobT [Histomonas meleagridis]KAH0799715.1 cobalamin biosynthesis protein CobT [Histomonas meleagridis]
MKIFVGIGKRYRALNIKEKSTKQMVSDEIVNAGFLPGRYAFKLYFQRHELPEGQIENDGVTDGSLVIARPALIGSLDLHIKSPEGKTFAFEVVPTTKVGTIAKKFFDKSGLDPEKHYLILNGQILKEQSHLVIDRMYRETDTVFCARKPELPEDFVMAYCTLGSDLLIEVSVPKSKDIKFMKGEIQKRYEINSENLAVYHKDELVKDDKPLHKFSGEKDFAVFTLELTGSLSAIFSSNSGEVQSIFNAQTTIGEIKRTLLPRKDIDADTNYLQFDGIKCDDEDCLFSYYRLKAKFTLYGTNDEEAMSLVNTEIKEPADNGDLSFCYIYANMLLNGINVTKDINLAAEYYKKASDGGHLSAMADYANLMFNGILPEEEEKYAYTLAHRAADEGHIGAQYLFGLMELKNGKDYEACSYFKKAAKLGHVLSETKLAYLILKDRADIKDHNQAKQYLQKADVEKYPPAMKTYAKILIKEGDEGGYDKMKEAAKRGNASALYYLANQHFAKKQYGKAYEYAKLSAEKGHAKAKRILGIMYKRGYEVQRDFTKAYEYLEQAYKDDDKESRFHLAKMILRGDGCEKNEEKAFELIQKCAKKAHKPSILLLCNMLLRGIGCKKDPEEAFRIANESAETSGYLKCVRFVGVCQLYGIGTEKNKDLALKNLIKASKKDILAMYYLAMILKDSPQYPQNRNEVIRYLKEAANKKLPEAMEALGLLLLEKLGYDDQTILNNKMEALNYFRQASQSGLIESKFQYGFLMLEFGEDDTQAAELIQEAAEKKHPLALYYLSLILEEGRGLTADSKRSLECLEESAKLDVALAQHRLGMIYAKEGNISGALKLLRKASEQEFVPAMLDLIKILRENNGEEEEIQKWLLKAAEFGDSNACVEGGKNYLKEGKYYEAFTLFKKAAFMRNIEGMFHYARMLEEGKGTSVNYEEAASFYRCAIDLGDIQSLYYLGRLYEKGLGVPQDIQNAFEYYEKSANNNDSNGMLGLGMLYLNGNGVAQNYEEAFKYFKESAQYNNVEAHYQKALLQEVGNGTDKNLEKAFKNFKFSAKKGHSKSMSKYSHMLMFGIGCTKDIDKGRKWLLKAVDFDECEALFEYAELLNHEKNETEALKYYKKAAEMGHIKSMNCAGVILMKDESTYKEAVKYFEKAANDDMNAACNYGLALAEGKGVFKDQNLALTYLRHAAESGIVEAMFNCGILLMTSNNENSHNEAEAQTMLENAANNGHVLAKYNLAILLLNNDKVQQNKEKAMKLLKESAKENCYEAMYIYAYYKFLDSNDDVDDDEAYTYARNAANNGNINAITLCGTMALNKRGAIFDNPERTAVQYFKSAAKENEPNALYSYAYCLIMGLGTEKDMKKAEELLNKAMEMGHPLARNLIDQFNLR